MKISKKWHFWKISIFSKITIWVPIIKIWIFRKNWSKIVFRIIFKNVFRHDISSDFRFYWRFWNFRLATFQRTLLLFINSEAGEPSAKSCKKLFFLSLVPRFPIPSSECCPHHIKHPGASRSVLHTCPPFAMGSPFGRALI